MGAFTDAATGHEHGFVDLGGYFTELDVPGAVLTEVRGINNNREIVGEYEDMKIPLAGYMGSARLIRRPRACTI